MNIQTKFDIGQEVYYVTDKVALQEIDSLTHISKLIDKNIKKFTITRVCVYDNQIYYDDYNRFLQNNNMFREEDCYATEEEAREYLRNCLRNEMKLALKWIK